MKTFPIGGVHPSDNKLSRAVAVERFALPDFTHVQVKKDDLHMLFCANMDAPVGMMRIKLYT